MGKTKGTAPASDSTLTAVEREIFKTTGAKPRGKKESDQDYRDRMARSVDEWTKKDKATSEQADERFDSLSEELQDWSSAAAVAVNENKPIPPFPGAPAESADDDEDKTPPQKGEKEQAVKTKKTKKAAAQVAEEPTKGTKKPKAKKPDRVQRSRGQGRHAIFRKRVVEAYLKSDGKVRFGEIYDAYEKHANGQAITRPSASVVYSNTVSTLQTVDEIGALKR